MFCEPTILIKQRATWGLGRVKGCLVLCQKNPPKIAAKIKRLVGAGRARSFQCCGCGRMGGKDSRSGKSLCHF